MKSLPIMVDLQGRSVLVVGGTPIATSRARLASQAGATVDWIREDGPMPLGAADGLRGLHVIPRPFRASDVHGHALVFAASGDPLLDAEVAHAAREAGRPINVADTPALCSFIVPAMVDRGPLTVSIASGGAAPALLTRLRNDLESRLPQGLGPVVEAAGGLRGEAKATIPGSTQRRDFWRSLFSPTSLSTLLALQDGAIEGEIRARMKAFAQGGPVAKGRVLLVGAGPGDPELLTLKAIRALSEADVVIYDRLVNPAILDYVRRDAERIYVGKDPSGPAVPQGTIDALLVERAQAGQIVLRLKGGDPMVFGRGGEELDRLKGAGIRVDVIPGVTAALGAAASMGVSLSQRDVSASITLTTGTLKGGALPDLKGLGGKGRTLAIYMGVRRGRDIARNLMGDGVPGDTPIAIVERATWAQERRVYGRLDALGDLIEEKGIQNPALLFVGDVVKEAELSAPTPGEGPALTHRGFEAPQHVGAL